MKILGKRRRSRDGKIQWAPGRTRNGWHGAYSSKQRAHNIFRTDLAKDVAPLQFVQDAAGLRHCARTTANDVAQRFLCVTNVQNDTPPEGKM